MATSVDKNKMCFKLVEYDRIMTSSAYVRKRYKLSDLSRLRIFLEFLSPEFISNVLDGFDQNTWHYGKHRHVLTNALTLTRNKAQTKHVVPGCDEYACMYRTCDQFNEFKGFHFPHKHGGKNHPGVFGAQHDFVMTSALKNTFNLYHDIYCNLQQPSREWTFQEHCLHLADELFVYACNMK